MTKSSYTSRMGIMISIVLCALAVTAVFRFALWSWRRRVVIDEDEDAEDHRQWMHAIK